MSVHCKGALEILASCTYMCMSDNKGAEPKGCIYMYLLEMMGGGVQPLQGEAIDLTQNHCHFRVSLQPVVQRGGEVCSHIDQPHAASLEAFFYSSVATLNFAYSAVMDGWRRQDGERVFKM